MHKLKSLLWTNGLLFLLGGIILFFYPATALRWVVIFIAVQTILSGAWTLYLAFKVLKVRYKTAFMLSGGAQLLFGLALLLSPQFGNFLLSLIIVLLAMVTIGLGLTLILQSIRIKKAQLPTWRVQTVVGVLMILWGLFVGTNAFLTMLSLIILLGLSFVSFGAYLIYKAWTLPSASKVYLTDD
ncbi:MAG: DUF308 domain-containing protein [bacterium]|nr:DUF308 domain-containing protein [bacterium]